MADIIDINVTETTEQVTINVVNDVIQVNINQVTGGGGGSQDLNQTLVNGNITDGENISISNGDAIILDNGSMLKKGTIDAGNGGAKGISQICGVGFEHKWEAGRLYIMNDGGTIIREVSHNLTYTPTVTDDVTKGFVQNTRWILDNGDLYVCTDPTEGAAVWELQSNIPTLQEVMELGRTYAQTISGVSYEFGFSGGIGYTQVTDATGFTSRTEYSGSTQGSTVDDAANNKYVYDSKRIDNGYEINLYDDTAGVDRGNRLLIPFKTSGTGVADFVIQNNLPAGTYELATLDDIPSTSTFVPYTGATQNVNLGAFDLYANKVWLYDAPNDNYGSLHFTDSDFHIEDADGHKMLVIEDGFVQLHKTDTIQSNLFTSGLSTTRDHYLPDESGTIALTSIVADAITNGVTDKAPSQNAVFDALALKQTDLFEFDTKQGFYLFEDFLGDGDQNSFATGYGFMPNASGTGAVCSPTITYPNRTNQQGVIQLGSGTTATGSSNIRLGDNNAGTLYLGQGIFTMQYFVNIETLSDATNRFYSIIGANTGSNFANTNGIFFIYDEGGVGNYGTASANWKCITRSGTTTVTTTTTPVTASQWYVLRIVVNANASSIEFFINGTSVATHTTNIPTLVTPRVAHIKTVGTTNRNIFCDYMVVRQIYTTPRTI